MPDPASGGAGRLFGGARRSVRGRRRGPGAAVVAAALLAGAGLSGGPRAAEEAGPPAAAPEAEPAVRAVQQVLPAVVNISTERVVRREAPDSMDLFFDRFFGGPLMPPREFRQTVQSLGSGFFVDADGYILTNEHVVERAADLRIKVTVADGKTVDAAYVAGDPASDLALIKVKRGEGAPPFPFVDLARLSPNLLGQTVLVLGNPLGYSSSVSRGILSAMDRMIEVEGAEYRHLLQTDAAINPGNSGGPLIDLAGRLVGVSSVKMAFSPNGLPVQGLGFAIPGDIVRERVADMRRVAHGGKVGPRPPVYVGQPITVRAFGLHVQDLTPELAETFGVTDLRGVLVAEVEEGGPAAGAGFRRGVLILRVGRYAIGGVAEIERVLAGVEKGDLADFTVAVPRQLGRRMIRQMETVTLRAR